MKREKGTFGGNHVSIHPFFYLLIDCSVIFRSSLQPPIQFPRINSHKVFLFSLVALKEVLDKPRKLYENHPRAPERGKVFFFNVSLPQFLFSQSPTLEIGIRLDWKS